MKRYGESGCPCLIPLSGRKKPYGLLFISIENEDDVTYDMIEFWASLENLNPFNIARINIHSIPSYALDMSNFGSKVPYFPFVFFSIERNNSWAMSILLVI